jgi:hypothetical protein
MVYTMFIPNLHRVCFITKVFPGEKVLVIDFVNLVQTNANSDQTKSDFSMYVVSSNFFLP